MRMRVKLYSIGARRPNRAVQRLESYMGLRKLLLATAPAVMLCLSALGAGVHPDLLEVKRVYLLPMNSGLDQYLANRLTREGRFEVVTDPATADAVFTDRLGPAFEDKWKELYPPPPKPEPVKEEKADTEGKSEKDKDKKKAEASINDFSAPPVNRVSSFSRGRGNVFLVSRKTGAVVWSHFKPARNSRAQVMDDTADDIADRLHKDVTIKK
jgi:hypothetical protein